MKYRALSSTCNVGGTTDHLARSSGLTYPAMSKDLVVRRSFCKACRVRVSSVAPEIVIKKEMEIRFHQSTRLFVSLLLAVSLSLVSCSVPSEEDQRRVELLRAKYGQKYDFRFEENLYVIAENRDGDEPTVNDAREIYETFWFTPNAKGERRATAFVYLNIFDKKKEFRFQIAWDEAKNDYVISERAYY